MNISRLQVIKCLVFTKVVGRRLGRGVYWQLKKPLLWCFRYKNGGYFINPACSIVVHVAFGARLWVSLERPFGRQTFIDNYLLNKGK